MFLLRAVLTAACLLALAGAAYAHAVVVETVPADGALLEAPPERIVIRFNEPVSVIAVRVIDSAGSDLAPPGAASARDGEVVIPFASDAGRGTYIASYRVVSTDGHPVGGSIVFSVGEASPFAPVPDATDDRGWRLAAIVLRVALDLGILGGAGAVLFLVLVRPSGRTADASAQIAATLALVGCAAALVAIGVQGGLLIGGPARAIGELATWRAGVESRFGRTALAALVGLGLIALTPRRSDALPARALSSVGAGIALLSFALSGHVVAAGSRWITVPALIAHSSAVAFWIGSLLPLRRALSLSEFEAAPLMRRFSRIAVAAVAVLALAGTIVAAVQVRSFSGLLGTMYGQLLLAKLALVAGLLGLAALNKVWLTPALDRGEPRAVKSLRVTIEAEIALVLAILTATAVLGTTPPPRVHNASAAADVHAPHEHHRPLLSLELSNADLRARITFASDESGANAAEIDITDLDGEAVTPLEVTLAASNPSTGIEAIRRRATAVGPGRWRVGDLMLVPAGEWTIRVEILVSDFEKPILQGTLALR